MICGSGGSKSRLAKAAGAEPSESGRMRNEKLQAVVARRTFPSQNVQKNTLLEVPMSKNFTPLCRKAHFQVKNVQNTPASDHFWK